MRFPPPRRGKAIGLGLAGPLSFAEQRASQHPQLLGGSVDSSPKLVQRPDGRYEIRCPQCERMGSGSRPIGIGLPVTSRAEAESIARNHAGRAA